MSGSSGALLLPLLAAVLLGAPGAAQPAGEAACRPVRAAFQVLQPGAKWVPEGPVPGETALSVVSGRLSSPPWGSAGAVRVRGEAAAASRAGAADGRSLCGCGTLRSRVRAARSPAGSCSSPAAGAAGRSVPVAAGLGASGMGITRSL